MVGGQIFIEQREWYRVGVFCVVLFDGSLCAVLLMVN